MAAWLSKKVSACRIASHITKSSTFADEQKKKGFQAAQKNPEEARFRSGSTNPIRPTQCL